MAKHTKASKKAQKPIDRFSGERGRGRPQLVIPSEVLGRAQNYRGIFGQNWKDIGKPLQKARTEVSIVEILEKSGAQIVSEFRPIADLILRVLRDRKFPTRKESQINFLADSIAAFGRVSARRSREICASERQKETGANQILRAEYYIVCSCKYKGPSFEHKCPKCNAEISFNLLPGTNPLVGME
jgi:hypothetical protein